MRLISVFLLAISVVFWGGLSFGRQTEKVFGNMTYWVGGPHSPRQVKLVNGKHEEDFLNIYYEGPFVYGDFNHDGLMDAAVVIMENFGGNADDYELAFLINDGKKLVHRASYYLDVWAIVNSVHVKDG